MPEAGRGEKGWTRCREMLPLDAFAPKPSLSSGRDSWCRACRAGNLRLRRQKAVGSAPRA
jgi:hypothetical protein